MQLPPARPAYIVPSLLAADFSRLGKEIAAAVAAGADRFQIDIMDGHFVPNISMGPMFVATARPHTELPLEAHLMVDEPERWIGPVTQAGADVVIVHAEATPHVHRALQQIREAGARPAVALNPGSPLTLIEEVLDRCAMVLLMTVNPGFGGQRFIHDVLPKIDRLRLKIVKAGLDCDIEVDGGIETDTIGEARRAGANVFVAGTSVFGCKDGVAAGLAGLRRVLDS